ncbi:MAG TPA: Gfo/Idh/MocA family oxidoreductase [Phaeodactylibacter sp.]|nr:Gfo/Idh/MocA family oxidoreductase [Phaeodactylibacter sp.]
MLKIGVLGTGHLGRIHLKCIQLAQETYELVGFYDPDDEAAQQVQEQYGVERWEDRDALIDAVDVVDIVTPTVTHFELAKKVMQAGKHLFIEKPLTNTLDEARQLLELSREKGVKVQVGHVERFNPALLALGDTPLNPMFIEAHRLAVFNPRGTDVSVILDLMIHDLDIIQSLVRSPVQHISASGVPVVSETEDICNARVEFENGCVANLTASRISMKQMRKLRLFQKDAYISLDFLEKEAQVVRLFDMDADPEQLPGDNLMELETQNGKRYIHMAMPETESVNAIKMELETFAQSIETDTRPIVNIEDGYRALELAHRIISQIEARRAALASSSKG